MDLCREAVRLEVLLYRDRESSLTVVTAGPACAFDADENLFRLVSEAHRIHLAHLFDPVLAVHTSVVASSRR